MDIKSLPRDVRAQLRSGANINSIVQCVTELVLNSLDAKSTAIAIRINLLTFRIQVVDNGKGVTKSSMNFIGIRYMTSKCQSLADLKKIKRFGFRGEALASIRRISKTINITSRPDNVENTYNKTYENGKWKAVELSKQRPSKGTTITIEGFMHNLPVRQKRIDQNLDLNEIKRMLEGLVIIHPNVSFNLRNDTTGKLIFQSNKTKSVTEALVNLYPDIDIQDLLEIKITKNKTSVTGLISKKPSTSNKLQFIYLNKRPINAPRIQKLVNSLLIKSLIYRQPSSDPHEKTENPIYVLNVKCPYSEVDLTLSPSKKTVEFKQWDVVLKCVEKAVVKLLEHENLIDVNFSKEEIDILAAPSFKSQFGVSQIKGACKSIAVKRKIFENVPELVNKRSKELNEAWSEGKIGTDEEEFEAWGSGKTVHNDRNPGRRRKSSHLAGAKDKNKTKDVREFNLNEANKNTNRRDKQEFEVSIGGNTATTESEEEFEAFDRGNQAVVEIANGRKVGKRKNKVLSVSGKETGVRPLVRNVNLNSDEDKVIKNTNKKSFKIFPGITKSSKNVKGRPIWLDNAKIYRIENKGDSNRKNKRNHDIPDNKEEKCVVQNIPSHNPKIVESQTDLCIVPDDQPTNPRKNTNIFDKHKNTQSLVLNSEVNATKSELNSLLNCTIDTNTLENQEKGKELIMDIFLKSTVVFPNEESVIKDLPPVTTVIVETTKANVVNTCRNPNATMMTMSWKFMSKKTIVTNSIHPTCYLDKSTSTTDDDNGMVTEIQCKGQNIRPKIYPKEKMVSKCIQTTMIEHQKELKIDFNCNPETNSKFIPNPQIDEYNVTFSKYFNEPINNEKHYWEPFGNNQGLAPIHNFQKPKVRNYVFPKYSTNHDGIRNNCNGKNFRKPIKKYFSDYNFDFSNFNVCEEPYQQFAEHTERHDYNNPMGRRTIPSRIYSHRYENNYNFNNDGTIPLYQCYKNINLGQNLNYMQNKPMDIFNTYDSDFQYQPYIYQKNRNICNEIGNNTELHEELYKSIYRDYGQQTYLQPFNKQRIEEQVKEDGIFKVPKLDKRIYLHPVKNNPNILMHKAHDPRDFNQPQGPIGHENAEQICCSPFFQNTRKTEERRGNKTNTAAYQNRVYYQNDNNPKKSRMNQNVITSCTSPFFHKTSNPMPVIEPRKMHIANQYVSNEPTNCLRLEPASNYSQTDEQSDFTIVLPSTERIAASRKQYTNRDGTVALPFFYPKENNCDQRLLFEQPEEQFLFPLKETNVINRDKHIETQYPCDQLFALPKENNVLNRDKQYPTNQHFFFENPEKQLFIAPQERDNYIGNQYPCEQRLQFEKPKKHLYFLPKESNLIDHIETQYACDPHPKKQLFALPKENNAVKRDKQYPSDQHFLFEKPEKQLFFSPLKRDNHIDNQYPGEQRLQFKKPEEQLYFLPEETNLIQRDNLIENEHPCHGRLLFENPNKRQLFFSPQERDNHIQHPSDKQLFVEKPEFFLAKQDNLLKQGNVRKQPENQEEAKLQSKQYQRLQESKKQDGENKRQGGFFEIRKPNDAQPTNDLLFSTKNAQPNWKLTANVNKNSHQQSKPSLRKFHTEPPQSHRKTFFKTLSDVPQTKTEQPFKKFLIEPVRHNFDNNFRQFASHHNSDYATPKLEYSFVTPNINKSNTVDDTIAIISLDETNNFTIPIMEQTEEQGNLTICSETFNPELCSTRRNVFEAKGLNLSPKVAPESFGSNFDGIIEASPNCLENSRKSSLLNISISEIKKCQLVQKEIDNECKLNQDSPISGESAEHFKNNFANSVPVNNKAVEHQTENKLEVMEVEDEWVEKVNASGRVFYIQKKTGMVSMFRPQQTTPFDLIKRIAFVPKGLSPMFIETEKIDATLSPTSKKSLHAAILENYESELNTIKWSNYIYNSNDANAFFQELYRERTKSFDCRIPNAGLNQFPRSMVKIYNNIQAESFKKDIFNELEIIGQLDSKFIIAIVKSTRLIILFDQHAVHERIRLEKLLNDYWEPDSDTVKFKSLKAHDKIVIRLTSSDLNVLSNFKNLFEKLGLQFIILADRIEVTHIPTCVYNKFVGNKEKSKESVEIISSLIHEQIAMVTSTRGVSSKIPNLIQNVINLEACRGAVKFGDKLTISECENYIKELSTCQLPFQCAHGRPTLIPIISIKSNLNTIKPNLKKLKR